MFDQNQLEAEQLTQWRCSCCGLSKPIGKFDTRELLRGETICGACVRVAAADRNRDGRPANHEERVDELDDLTPSDGSQPTTDPSHRPHRAS